MFGFPPVQAQEDVDANDRSSAVDFVNRVNWWFETWNIDAIGNSNLNADLDPTGAEHARIADFMPRQPLDPAR